MESKSDSAATDKNGGHPFVTYPPDYFQRLMARGGLHFKSDLHLFSLCNHVFSFLSMENFV